VGAPSQISAAAGMMENAVGRLAACGDCCLPPAYREPPGHPQQLDGHLPVLDDAAGVHEVADGVGSLLDVLGQRQRQRAASANRNRRPTDGWAHGRGGWAMSCHSQPQPPTLRCILQRPATQCTLPVEPSGAGPDVNLVLHGGVCERARQLALQQLGAVGARVAHPLRVVQVV
jgi:hypothetical protein